MKRTSKILAILLSVLVLCGVIALSVSASDSESTEATAAVHWLDPDEGEVFKIEAVKAGDTLTPETDIIVNKTTGMMYMWEEDPDIDTWFMDVGTLNEDGTISFSESDIDQAEIDENGKKIIYIQLNPELVVDSTELAFYSGTYVEDAYKENGYVRPLSYDETIYESYLSMDNLVEAFSTEAYGKDYVLLTDGYDIGNANQLMINTSATRSLDLNGKRLVRAGGATISASTLPTTTLFEVRNKATFNLYSSEPGAEIYHFYPTSTTAVSSRTGCIRVRNGVDECTVNVGGIRGDKGITYNGGSLIMANSEKLTTAAKRDGVLELMNDKKININIDGVKVYSFAQTQYKGVFELYAPDIVLTIKNSDIYAHSSTNFGAIFDLGQTAAFASQESTNRISYATIEAYNCNFISNPKTDSSNTHSRLFHTITNKTTAYFEDCTFVTRFLVSSAGTAYADDVTYTDAAGATQKAEGCSITFGPDNVISATHTDFNSDDVKKYVIWKDGVEKHLFDSSTEFTVDQVVEHADIVNTVASTLDFDGKSTYSLKSGVLDREKVQASVSRRLTAITYDSSKPVADRLSNYLAEVEWLDTENGNVLGSAYAFVGTEITQEQEPYDKLDALPELNNGWCKPIYRWRNITEGQDEDSLTVQKGENVFVDPKPVLVTDIRNVQMNLVIRSSEEFELRFYLPVPGEDATISFGSITDTAGSGNYLKGEDTKIGDIDYKVGFVSHPYNTVETYTRRVNYTAAYDFNENGVIEADETFDLYQDFDLCVVDYAKAILKNFDHGSDETKLLYQLVTYSQEYNTFANESIEEEQQSTYNSFFKSYSNSCTCENVEEDADTGLKKCPHICDLSALEPKNTDVNYEDLKDYIEYVTYGIDTKDQIPRFVLKLKAPADTTRAYEDVYTVSVTYDCHDENGSKTTATVECDVNSDGFVSLNGIPIQYSTEKYTIAITVEGGSVPVTGTYSLGAYVSEMDSVSVTKALYALSEAAYNYMVVTKNEVPEFDTEQ